MTDEIRTILLALAYAMEEGEIDAGGGGLGAPLAGRPRPRGDE